MASGSRPKSPGKAHEVMMILDECVKSSEEVKNECSRFPPEAINKYPDFKILVEKVDDDVEKIKNLKLRIQDLNQWAKAKKFPELKNEMNQMLESMSNQNILRATEALASSNTSKVKKEFEGNLKALSKMDMKNLNDENVKSLVKILNERNEKVIKCLKKANSMLPKFFGILDAELSELKAKKTLYLINDESEVSNISMQGRREEFFGEVLINIDSSNVSHSPESLLMNSFMTPDYREKIYGVLIDEDNNKTEVLLKWKEDTRDLMNFTVNPQTKEPIVKIHEASGRIIPDVTVVEIDINEEVQHPIVFATVANEATGEHQEVPVQVVPVDADNQVHGEILNLSNISQERPKTAGERPRTPGETPKKLLDLSDHVATTSRGSRKDMSLFQRLNKKIIHDKIKNEEAKVNTLIGQIADEIADVMDVSRLENIEMDLVNNSYNYHPDANSSRFLPDVSDDENLLSMSMPSMSSFDNSLPTKRNQDNLLIDISGISASYHNPFEDDLPQMRPMSKPLTPMRDNQQIPDFMEFFDTPPRNMSVAEYQARESDILDQFNAIENKKLEGDLNEFHVQAVPSRVGEDDMQFLPNVNTLFTDQLDTLELMQVQKEILPGQFDMLNEFLDKPVKNIYQQYEKPTIESERSFIASKAYNRSTTMNKSVPLQRAKKPLNLERLYNEQNKLDNIGSLNVTSNEQKLNQKSQRSDFDKSLNSQYQRQNQTFIKGTQTQTPSNHQPRMSSPARRAVKLQLNERNKHYSL